MDFMDEVYQHSIRVAALAYDFGKYLGLKESDRNTLLIAGYLHDLGKKYLPEDIIYKPNKLSTNEYRKVKEHPVLSAEKLHEIHMPTIVSRVSYEHHERVDGKGYPRGLKDDEIHDFSKIISICDSYDAMRYVRIYKEKYTIQECIDEIEVNLGTQFSRYYGIRFIQFIKEREMKEKEVV